MSYINEALRKAQKEKASRYDAYAQIVDQPDRTNNRPKRWLPLTGIMTALLLAAGLIAFLYWPGNKNNPENAPVKSAMARQAAPGGPSAPASAVVQETTIPGGNAAPAEKETGIAGERISAEIKANPKAADSGSLYRKALQKQNEGRLDEAKSLYKQVIEIDPQNIQALNNLGVIYMAKNVDKWAIIRFNDAIRIKPDYSEAHYNLACLYAQQHDVNRSLFYLKNAVKFNPEVRKWAKSDDDLKVLAGLPEFKRILETKRN